MPKIGHDTPRRIRNDALIGNVEVIQKKAPDLIKTLGPEASVGDLRAAFGGKDIAEILALPKTQRAAAVEAHMAQLGVDNKAAKASVTGALLADRVSKGKDYYVQLGGKKLDRGLLLAFVASTSGKNGPVSAGDAATKIVPEMIDGNGMTSIETATYLFAMQHFKVTDKAVREKLIPALRTATGAPVKQLKDGQQGFDFMELYDHLEKTGRLADLYSAKTDMSDAEMLAMWDNGISLQDLNAHLESALEGKSAAKLKAQFGSDFDAVQTWLKQKGDKATLKRLAEGKVSAGELQNLIYGSWKMENTPFDPNYKATFEPFPTTHAPMTEAKFLDGIVAAVGAHDWKSLLGMFDPLNRETQRGIGVTSDAQYIAEGLGLHMVDNSLPGDITKQKTLDQIQYVTLHKPDPSVNAFAGTATLKDGTVLNVSFGYEQTKSGFQITPAVG